MTFPTVRFARYNPNKAAVAREKLWERHQRRYETALTRLGKRVRSIRRLSELAQERRSVVIIGGLGLRPASWILAMQAGYVQRQIDEGRMYEYRPIRKGGVS